MEHNAAREHSTPMQFNRGDWMAILKRVWVAIGEDNISLVAAGVAFYSMLALFPALVAAVGLYGLVADSSQVVNHLSMLSRFMPADAFELIESQLKEIAGADSGGMTLAALLGIGFALWTAKAGVNALISGLNIVYHETEARNFIVRLLVSLALTALLILVMLVAVATMLVTPIVLDMFQLGSMAETLASILRWPLAIGAVLLAVGVLYRYGPHRRNAKMQWFTIGAVVGTALWIGGSALFSWYVSNFGNYNETYGSLGAIIGLLMWMWLSAFIILLGAELNAEMEHQTIHDTTVGEPRPVGERGAYMADHVASSGKDNKRDNPPSSSAD